MILLTYLGQQQLIHFELDLIIIVEIEVLIGSGIRDDYRSNISKEDALKHLTAGSLYHFL